jgi:peroxiredoxin Q/BCP
MQTDCGTLQLQAGQPAPEFELPDADMQPVNLADFRKRNVVVLYFYPKDDTPACTMQAIEFSDLQDEFARSSAVVLGVNKDDCLSHGAFLDKHGLAVQLLADVDGEVCSRYGVLQEKEHEGRKKTCIQRSTFVIDKDGIIRRASYGVSPRGHAAEVLGFLRSAGKWK